MIGIVIGPAMVNNHFLGNRINAFCQVLVLGGAGQQAAVLTEYCAFAIMSRSGSDTLNASFNANFGNETLEVEVSFRGK